MGIASTTEYYKIIGLRGFPLCVRDDSAPNGQNYRNTFFQYKTHMGFDYLLIFIPFGVKMKKVRSAHSKIYSNFSSLPAGGTAPRRR